MQLLLHKKINIRRMFLIVYAFSLLNSPKRNAESVRTFGLYFFSPMRLPSVGLSQSHCLCSSLHPELEPETRTELTVVHVYAAVYIYTHSVWVLLLLRAFFDSQTLGGHNKYSTRKDYLYLLFLS